jgi:hypothetical protein
MQPDSVFAVLNYSILLPWLLLLVAPRWKWTRRLVHSGVVPGVFAVAYVLVMLLGLGVGGSAATLPQAVTNLGTPWGITALWAHLLVFDLFVGAWEARDAELNGIPHLLMVPCLLLTLFFGPAGWGLYLGVRFVRLQLRTPSPS